MAAGNAGGTQIVIKFSALSIIRAVEVPLWTIVGTTHMKPIIERSAMIPTNF